MDSYADGNIISYYTKLRDAFLVLLVISLKKKEGGKRKRKKKRPNESSGPRSKTTIGGGKAETNVLRLDLHFPPEKTLSISE